ncbi:MAG TPA: heme-binding protein [Gryllotalpicola sp.]
MTDATCTSAITTTADTTDSDEKEQDGPVKQYIETVAISHELALHIVSVAIEQGAAAGVNVAVTIVDPAMALVAYARADGITPHSAETSRRKAQTAASTRRPSGWMQGDFGLVLPLGSGNLLTNVKGGFPLRFDGRLLGGLGVAGGTPDQDEAIALAVLDAVGAEH